MGEQSNPKDEQKRNFLKIMGILIIGAGIAGTLRSVVQNVLPAPVQSETSFPTLLLTLPNGNPVHTTDLVVNNPQIVEFYYPLKNEPNFLLRLGDSSGKDVKIDSTLVRIPATGQTYKSPAGVGPYGSVVASSAICQHLGCIPPEIRYHPPSSGTFPGKIHCDCHGSTYDPYAGFSVVTGPTTHPLPSLVLSYDSSKDMYSATMMVGPTVYGHTSDLSGGQAITTTTTSVSTIPG
ncbi:MAG: Rieske 2Fe-2S domain-containing protein [Thermoplasmatales archaeon]